MFSDTIRQLESVASANLVPQETVDALTQAYRTYRTEIHHRSLQAGGEASPTSVVDAGRFQAERAAVTAAWNVVMSGA